MSQHQQQSPRCSRFGLDRRRPYLGAALVLLKSALQRIGIYTRCRDVSAQSVDRQHGQREQNTLAQVRNAEDIGQLLEHLLQNLNFAAGFGDLFLRRLGKLVSVYGDGAL